MRYTIKTRFALTALFALILSMVVIYIAYRSYMKYQGYCWEEQRYISKEEKIRRSVQKILDDYPPYLFLEENEKDGGNKGWTPDQPIVYKNFEHFIQENPDCCQWGETTAFTQPEGNSASFMNRFLGIEIDFVWVRYSVRFIKDGRYRSESKDELFGLSGCAIPHSFSKYHR